MRVVCSFGGESVEESDPELRREVRAWVKGMKQDSPSMRELTGRIMCGVCYEKIQRGQPPGQPSMFEEAEASGDARGSQGG